MTVTYLDILRQLADQQQFAALKDHARHALDEQADVRLLPLLALAHAQLGEREHALTVSAQAHAHLSDLDLDARVDLAAVYCLLWRLPDAIALLEPALVEQPQHSLALARLAWCRLHEGRFDESRRLYEDATRLAPQRLPTWSALIRLYLDQNDSGNIDAAQNALHTAIEQLQLIHTALPQLAVAQFTAQFRHAQLEIWVVGDRLAEAEQWLDQRRETLSEDDWAPLLVAYAAQLAGHDRHAVAEDALREGAKHYPHNLALLSQLAELAQLQGRTPQVMRLLRRAISIAKSQGKPEVALWVRLSGASLQQSEQQARKAADKAMELAAALTENADLNHAAISHLQLQARCALAAAESNAQNFDAADALYRDVLLQSPWFLPALQGLGQQQMQRGRIDEAIELFERVRLIDPAKGYSALINARQFPDDETTLLRLEQVAHQPSLEGRVRSGLLFQLAAAWEKRKDYDKAFAFARNANDASKRFLHYDPLVHRQRCARIRHAFCKALYQHRSDCGVDSTLPIFVLGMPRSGTTLVEQILAGHSQIHGAGELGIIPQLIAGLERWERHTGSGRHYPDCVDDLSPPVVAGMAANVLKELQEYAPDARHVVDKLPHNFENIGLIKLLFPRAKIISVRRDPRDIALSNYFTDYAAKHGGMGFAYDLRWIGEQLADHNLLMHHWAQVFPGDILEVKYEDVVADAAVQARRMLEYIGVDYEPQVVNFSELERPVKTASVWQVRQPIYDTSKAKWLRYEKHLAPLLAGTNARIEWQPITDMVTLPEPGWLNAGVEFYRQRKLDDAERCFGKLLHHLPDHAAANFMLGLIYVHKGYLDDGIALMEKAHKRCPWNANWRNDLAQACELAGLPEKALALKNRTVPAREPDLPDEVAEHDGDAAW